MNYVSAEMKNPSRDIPRVVHTALPTVIGIALKLSNDSLVFPGEYRVLCSTSDRDIHVLSYNRNGHPDLSRSDSRILEWL